MGTVKVKNLGKLYRKYSNRWYRLLDWFSFGTYAYHHQHWVLRGISFTIEPGQAVGLIGMNGSGKSTLLKLITGTSMLTEGSVEITGRVAALLELGLGFHPDFTGRQNVYMSAQLMGLDNQQIQELMPDIEEFAEIGSYIDEQVRVYSSGMQIRLAFSVATALRPDILIVDEALSVGDAYFQHKSFERIRKYRDLGTTLLLVSHDKQAIQSICDYAILLDKGSIAKQGKPEEVMNFYNAIIADREKLSVSQIYQSDGRLVTTSGTGEAKIDAVKILDSEGSELEVVEVGQDICLQVEIKVQSFIEKLIFGYGIRDKYGQVVYGTNTAHSMQPLFNLNAGDMLLFNVEFRASLGPGSYSIQLALTGGETHLNKNYEWQDLAMVFHVVNTTSMHFEGCNWLEPKIKIRNMELLKK